MMIQEERPARKKRRDRGTRLMTARDMETLAWIAEQYAVRFDHVRYLLGRRPGHTSARFAPRDNSLGVSSTLQVINRWIEEPAWSEYKRFYVGAPGWVWVSSYGIEVLSSQGYIPAYSRHSPKESMLDHCHITNAVRLNVQGRHPEYSWVSERSLRRMYGRREEGEELSHLPDGQLWLPGQQVIAVEVELSPKSPEEYDQIFEELLVSGAQMLNGTVLRYTAVWYFVSSNNSVRVQARRLVEAARQRLSADVQRFVQIIDIEQV